MMLRRFRRAVALGFILAFVILRYWLARLRGPMTLERRAHWVQGSASGILSSLGVKYEVDGQPPTCGLVVANHLSYLDILIISSAMPCFFVAKMEIDSWPYFGKAARTGGTIFVDRSSLASAMSVAEQISERLSLPIPVPVLLFPEGTSTDGAELLRFHSRLIDPATMAGVPITTAALRYVIEGGVEERELCWYGDESFTTHLWKVLGVAGFSAQVHFGQPQVYPHRRIAADQTHDELRLPSAQHGDFAIHAQALRLARSHGSHRGHQVRRKPFYRILRAPDRSRCRATGPDGFLRLHQCALGYSTGQRPNSARCGIDLHAHDDAIGWRGRSLFPW